MIQNRTVKLYNDKADGFIVRYDKADMSTLHKLLLAQLRSGTDVLDIGFGSGRDLAFLLNYGFNIWGVDPAENVVKHARKKFADIWKHFALGSLPDLKLPQYFPERFDAITLIAVLMHLPSETYKPTVQKICNLLADNGKVILSYSIGYRNDKERYFENIDSKTLENLFKKYGCQKIYQKTTSDGLGRDSIVWKTEIYELL